MTPRRRANAIQAHSLHCQGLTYRQIGERMHRSVSTVATYIKDFHTHRDEITASLAADQLVHSLAGINTPDPDLHQQHINTARELRLQVDTLDKVTERRQRRDRRIQEEQIKDFTRESKAAEELAKTLIENDLWEDPTPLNHFAATGQLLPKSSPSGGAVAKRLRGARPDPSLRCPAPRRGAQCTQLRQHRSALLTSNFPKETHRKPHQTQIKLPKTQTNPNKSEQIRTKPNKLAPKPPQNRPNPHPNAEKQRNSAAKSPRNRNYPRDPQNPPAPSTRQAGTTHSASSPDEMRKSL